MVISQNMKDPKILPIAILLIVGIVVGGIVGYGATAGQINYLQTQIVGLQNQIASLQSDKVRLQGQINALNSQISILSAPVFSLPAGTYNSDQIVYIYSTLQDARIYYTLDGSNPSNSSIPYSGQTLEIRQNGTTLVKAIAVKDSFVSDVSEATYIIDYGNVPLGQIGGLHYIWWNFGQGNFRALHINITIYSEPDSHDGLYYQMYQGYINGEGFYFGLQTAVYRPGVGNTGKGIIFSRWGTNDLSNAIPADGGWADSGYETGSYIGVRLNYPWTSHRYQLAIEYHGSDSVGDWYRIEIYDITTDSWSYLGTIRFPSVPSSNSGIADGGGTWTELYMKDIPQTPIPSWHVSIDNIFGVDVSGVRYYPSHATSDYSSIDHTDIYYDIVTRKIHFIMGPTVSREHNTLLATTQMDKCGRNGSTLYKVFLYHLQTFPLSTSLSCPIFAYKLTYSIKAR